MDTKITFHIDAETKAQMEDICAQIGMTTSDAFNHFWPRRLSDAKGIPFPVNLCAPLEVIPSEQLRAGVGQTLCNSGEDDRRMAE